MWQQTENHGVTRMATTYDDYKLDSDGYHDTI